LVIPGLLLARYPADYGRFRLPVEEWLPVSQGDGKENVRVSFDEI